MHACLHYAICIGLTQADIGKRLIKVSNLLVVLSSVGSKTIISVHNGNLMDVGWLGGPTCST